jgi:hypothetical protein
MAIPAIAHGTPQQGSGKLDDFKIKGEAPYYAEEREGWKGYIEWEVCHRNQNRIFASSLTFDLEIPREEGRSRKDLGPIRVSPTTRVPAQAFA